MMVGNDRADALYAVVAARPEFAGLNKDEQASVRTQLRTLFGADTSYIQGAAEVAPGSLLTPAGATVATPTGPGSVTTPTALQGRGKVL